MKSALLLATAFVCFLHPSDPAELVSRQTVGDVFEEKESSWSSSSTSAAAEEENRPSFGANIGSEGARSFVAIVERHRTILDEVLAVSDGRRTKVKRTYLVSTSSAADASSAEPTPRLQSAAFEGQTVVLVADGDGTRIVGEIDGEEELGASDRSLTSRWELLLPGRPVAIGESWSLSEDVSKRLLEGLDVARASASCTLDGVDAKAAGKPARIKIDIQATGAGEAGSDIHATGEVLWSTGSDHLVEAALTARIHTVLPDLREENGEFRVRYEVAKLE